MSLQKLQFSQHIGCIWLDAVPCTLEGGCIGRGCVTLMPLSNQLTTYATPMPPANYFGHKSRNIFVTGELQMPPNPIGRLLKFRI